MQEVYQRDSRGEDLGTGVGLAHLQLLGRYRRESSLLLAPKYDSSHVEEATAQFRTCLQNTVHEDAHLGLGFGFDQAEG